MHVASSMAYFYPQLVYASQCPMHVSSSMAYLYPQLEATSEVGVLYQTFSPALCKYFTLATVPGLYSFTFGVHSTCMRPLQQELFNWESAEVWLTDRSVHQKLEFWIWLSASVMHLPTLASRRRMYTMKLLPLAVSTAPIVPQNLSRNTSLLTIEKPVTHMNVY